MFAGSRTSASVGFSRSALTQPRNSPPAISGSSGSVAAVVGLISVVSDFIAEPSANVPPFASKVSVDVVVVSVLSSSISSSE